VKKDYNICIEGAISGENKNANALYLVQIFIKHSNEDDSMVDCVMK